MLIRELTKVAGDPKAVETVLNHWLETQDVTRLSLICMSTVQQLFAEYLTKPEPPNERTAP